MPAFAVAIFTGAFLLFQIQPLIGKYILPWFGGSPGVWTTCMLFFQVLLLGGYGYAHALGRRCRPRKQVIVHLSLLALALATLPIIPADTWKPGTDTDPTWRILALLAATLGLPYVVLAATGPLMQDWFRRSAPGVSPYRLYALSNVGSLLALVSYPLVFETFLSRQEQARVWSWGLVAYGAACAWCAWRVWRAAPTEEPAPGADAVGTVEAPRAGDRLLWVALPACASVLLLAVTNKMCQDVAVIPFLWVLPLALYLLTFIIAFDSPRWYSRFYYTIALSAALAAGCAALHQGPDMEIVRQVAIYAVLLFTGCMVCHGELYRLRPHPRHLTSFYLMISAGGAAGGLFVALVAPAVFDNFYETHLSFLFTAVLLVVMAWRGRADLNPGEWRILGIVLALAGIWGLQLAAAGSGSWLRGEGWISASVSFAWDDVARRGWVVWLAAALAAALVAWRRRGWIFPWDRVTCGLLAVGCVALAFALGVQVRNSSRGAVVSGRNFYGVLSVFEYEKDNPLSHHYVLQHGRITHGLQFAAPDRAAMPTSYFPPRSGLGLALRNFPRQENQRIGLLGLGVGTVTAYGKPGDVFRIYEINPQVIDIARKPFSYLALTKAQVELAVGDARLVMEHEAPQGFDFLIMDAFSSDAVPVHLLTREAFEIYQRHLKPDGAMIINISNRYLDLRPVVENAARLLGYDVLHFDSEDGAGEDEEGGWWFYAASFMVLSKNKEFMARTALRSAASPPTAVRTDIPLWTDDYASMFRILK
ncbi:MAG: hypothetical protein RLZZ188_884 [Verrucomicrobiota bacterium]|jgi:hypothetical protein